MKRVISIWALLLFFVVECGAQQENGDGMSCREYVDSVLSYDKGIEQNRLEQISLYNAVKYAKANLYPRLDLSGEMQYRVEKSDLEIGGGNAELPHNSYNANLNLSQKLYGGALKSSYKAAQVELEMAVEEGEMRRLEVEYAATLNYWGTAAKRELYNAVCNYVEIISSLRDLLKSRFEEGLISKTDYLQIEARLREARISQSDMAREYRLAMQNLNSMMGVNPDREIILSDSISLREGRLQFINPDEALIMRPDFIASRLGSEYRRLEMAQIKSPFNPQLDIGVRQSWGRSALDLAGSAKFSTIGLISLNVPIFSWRARNYRVAGQKVLIESSEVGSERLSNDIVLEIMSSWRNYIESSNQIELALEAKKIAWESLDLNTYSYNQGKLTILEVLSAQVTWIQANSRYIEALLREKEARAAYIRATGSH